ncbi:MAG: aminotransferase class I/II-fold pyridoxal phosphate-dependent enzyme [Spirochaetales bacterium]|nr:aminotransferase class I/II-fold pyridoxal phosphate-dependent enzyme [Spirochaetales bacterium]
MNAIAKELNEILKGTAAAELLSGMGREMFFPKGIVAQSAEAKQKAHTYNATVGMATQQGDPLYLPSIHKKFNGLNCGDIFPYAPTPGDPKLRQLWKKEMIRKNPALTGTDISLPLVTAGLTHGVSIIADLFLDSGDTIIVPDMFWGNYRLIFEVRRQAEIAAFSFFTEEGTLNIDALSELLDRISSKKIVLIVNFPNNPTGYSPTVGEAEALTALLVKNAEAGKKILIMTDDAYFGLFYEEGTCTQSLFAYLADAHENILAVKGDAATKEELVWGFRVGFLTYGGKGMTENQYDALIKKTMGAIRSSVSNCSRPAQTLLLHGMASGSYSGEKEAAFTLLSARYQEVKKVLSKYTDNPLLRPMPFNSGYFMAFTCSGSAEDLRVYLLEKYGIGTISIQDTYLRIAYSSVDVENIEDLYNTLYKAAQEVWT